MSDRPTSNGQAILEAIRQEHEAHLKAQAQHYQGVINSLRVQMAETESRLEIMGNLITQEANSQIEASKEHYTRTAAQYKEISDRWKLEALKSKAENRSLKAQLGKAQTRIDKLEKAVEQCLYFGAVVTGIAVVAIAAAFSFFLI